MRLLPAITVVFLVFAAVCSHAASASDSASPIPAWSYDTKG